MNHTNQITIELKSNILETMENYQKTENRWTKQSLREIMLTASDVNKFLAQAKLLKLGGEYQSKIIKMQNSGYDFSVGKINREIELKTRELLVNLENELKKNYVESLQNTGKIISEQANISGNIVLLNKTPVFGGKSFYEIINGYKAQLTNDLESALFEVSNDGNQEPLKKASKSFETFQANINRAC